MANADLVRYANGTFRCVELLCNFGNLLFLSLTFNTIMELQQKVRGRDDGQTVVKELVERLKKLKTLYIFHCPSDKIVIKSESLERLHIYRSEFAAFEDLHAPKLRTIMFQGHAREVDDGAPSLAGRRSLLEIIFDGCPALEQLNNVSLVPRQRDRDVGRSAWCRDVRQVCFKKYNESVFRRSRKEFADANHVDGVDEMRYYI